MLKVRGERSYPMDVLTEGREEEGEETRRDRERDKPGTVGDVGVDVEVEV